jgi:anti-sigma-K factor RskA
MDHARFEELKEAYVLNALPEDEMRVFEEYLAAHPELQADVEELASVANLLAFACEERDPPPELRRNLLTQVESEARSLPTTRATWWIRFRESINWRRVSVGLAAATFAGLLAWNIVLQSELQNLQIYNLQASGSAAGARGEVIYIRNANEAMLVAENLPSLPEDKTYQIWVMKDEKPIPGGVFKPQENGEGAAPITRSISEADAVAVTDEPAPQGSSTPTGSMMLQTKL